MEEERTRAEAVSMENMKVLEAQNPRLAESPPWAHVIGAPEKGCLLWRRIVSFECRSSIFIRL